MSVHLVPHPPLEGRRRGSLSNPFFKPGFTAQEYRKALAQSLRHLRTHARDRHDAALQREHQRAAKECALLSNQLHGQQVLAQVP